MFGEDETARLDDGAVEAPQRGEVQHKETDREEKRAHA
jgi:hypothetical protein